MGAVASGISPTGGGRTPDRDPCPKANQQSSLGSIAALWLRPSRRTEWLRCDELYPRLAFTVDRPGFRRNCPQIFQYWQWEPLQSDCAIAPKTPLNRRAVRNFSDGQQPKPAISSAVLGRHCAGQSTSKKLTDQTLIDLL